MNFSPIGAYVSIVSNLYSQNVLAILTENGTCMDETQKVPPQILNNNGINGSFQKLISDNRELAEIICQNLLNGNATTNISPFKIPDILVTSNQTLN